MIRDTFSRDRNVLGACATCIEFAERTTWRKCSLISFCFLCGFEHVIDIVFFNCRYRFVTENTNLLCMLHKQMNSHTQTSALPASLLDFNSTSFITDTCARHLAKFSLYTYNLLQYMEQDINCCCVLLNIEKNSNGSSRHSLYTYFML